MDHERVTINSSAMSCGVLLLSRISTETEEVLYALASRIYHPSRGDPCAFFVWSDIVDPKLVYHRLAEKVETLGFGVVEVSTPAENPKTGNIIAVFTWAINHETFKPWYAHMRKKKFCKVGA